MLFCVLGRTFSGSPTQRRRPQPIGGRQETEVLCVQLFMHAGTAYSVTLFSFLPEALCHSFPPFLANGERRLSLESRRGTWEKAVWDTKIPEKETEQNQLLVSHIPAPQGPDSALVSQSCLLALPWEIRLGPCGTPKVKIQGSEQQSPSTFFSNLLPGYILSSPEFQAQKHFFCFLN